MLFKEVSSDIIFNFWKEINTLQVVECFFFLIRNILLFFNLEMFHCMNERVTFDMALLISCGADSDLLTYTLYVLITFESP